VDVAPTNAPDFLVAERESGQRLLRLLAAIGVALVFVVIVSSAYLRLSQAGLSCPDWPACYGRVAQHAEIVGTAQRTVRLAHRLAASSVAVVLIALLLIAATRRPRRRRQTALAVAGLLIAVGLATIGAVMSETATRVPLPAVTLANLTGGFALLALLWWLWLTTGPAETPMQPHQRWVKALAAVALLALIVQVALGALVSAKFAALACPGFPLCGADMPSGTLLENLNPFAELIVGANGAIARPPPLAALHWAHRVGAHVVLVCVAFLAFGLIRAGSRARRLGVVIAALVVVQLALGAASVLAHLPLAIVLAHNFVAALLLAALIMVNEYVHAAERRDWLPGRRLTIGQR
jgi:heme A synthase